jgi:hypothetical protein
MLFWHLGLKRTGTTSLQTALVTHEADLENIGFLYPKKWRQSAGLPGSSSHFRLREVIAAELDSPLVVDFRSFLRHHSERSVVLSSEFVTDWLGRDVKRDAVLGALAAAQEVTPVTCMWSLRRLDDMLNSQLHRHLLWGGTATIPWSGNVARVTTRFANALIGMHRIEQVLDRRVVYAKYTREGTHNRELLRAMRLPVRVREPIEDTLARGLRLNSQLTCKGLSALCHPDAILERAGGDLTLSDLRRVFLLGQFEFAEDRPCDLVGGQVRRRLHEGALRAAEERGIERYIEFFGEAKIHGPDRCGANPPVLTDQDVDSLLDYARYLRHRGVETVIAAGHPGDSVSS